MEASDPAGLPDSFWSRVGDAPHRLLMFDYDGTLAPLRIERAEALPYPGIADRLRSLAGFRGLTLAIVSGRPVDELEGFLDSRGMILIGEHGWDVRGPDGARIRHPLPHAAAEALDRAERVARADGFGSRLERKRSGVVLHTRGLDPARARSVEADLEERWQPIAGEGTLRLDRTDGGLELRALGHDKGSAAASLIGACPSRTIAVFVGDDRSDEDAFEVVSSGGFGVRVGAHRASRATLRLEPERLSEFLDQWLRVAARAS